METGFDPNQSSRVVFDLEEGYRRREEGAEAARTAADRQWERECRDLIREWGRAERLWTTDDLWREVGGPPTGSNKAMGGLVSWALRKRLARNTGQYVPSKRPEARSRRIAVLRGIGSPR